MIRALRDAMCLYSGKGTAGRGATHAQKLAPHAAALVVYWNTPVVTLFADGGGAADKSRAGVLLRRRRRSSETVLSCGTRPCRLARHEQHLHPQGEGDSGQRVRGAASDVFRGAARQPGCHSCQQKVVEGDVERRRAERVIELLGGTVDGENENACGELPKRNHSSRPSCAPPGRSLPAATNIFLSHYFRGCSGQLSTQARPMPRNCLKRRRLGLLP